MKHIILLSLVLALGACGEEKEAGGASTSSASTSQSSGAVDGVVTFKAMSKETAETHGGIISECHITFEVTNGLGSNIDRACVKYDLVTGDSAAYDAATRVRGTQKVCGRNLKKRQQETVVEKITTAGCDEISALQVASFECFDDAKKCLEGAYVIDGNNIINIKR